MSQRVALLCNVFIFCTLCCCIGVYSDTVDVSVTFVAPDISVGEDGLINVTVEGCENSGKPGAPLLPVKTLYYALPPDTDIESVILTTVTVSTAMMNVSEVVAPTPAIGIIDRGFDGSTTTIIDGMDIDIYRSDQYYPVCHVLIDHIGQMRKWILVRVCIFPVQYNPVQQKLRYIQSAGYQLVYETKKQRGLSSLRSDTMMDDQAMQLIANQAEAQEWYSSDRSVSSYNVYAIITTDTIYNQSPGLYGLVAHKQSLGYTVYVVTETRVNGNSAAIGWNEVAGQAPNGKSDRIRKWLQNYYSGYQIRYVLLIGDPDPDTGDVPMKTCYPSSGVDCPTDAYYADLTGNWDVNGDRQFGNYSSDQGSLGVDFFPEVYVGRIPVYNAEYETLRDIISKIIHYQMDVSTAWRRAALLPESFLDNEGTDGAYVAAYILSNYLTPASYRSYTMYQQGSVDARYDSIFSSNEELLNDAVPNHWRNNPYGLICWFAHGSSIAAHLYGSGAGLLMESRECLDLDDRFPALAFMISCNCANPDHSGNLSYSLLKNGGIASVAASRSAYYIYGVFKHYRGPQDAPMTACLFMKHVVNDQQAFGQALYDAKPLLGMSWRWEAWMNMFVFNLYGDPGVKLLDSFGIDSDGDLIPDYWENQYGLSPGNPADAREDPDGDGFNNYREYMNRTSPLVVDPILSDYSSMTVGGSFQGWEVSANNMALADDYTWEGEVSLANATNIQFRFFADMDWRNSWGDSAQQDVSVPIQDTADESAHNITCSGVLNGRYRVTFNEQTLLYSVESCE